MSYPPVPPDNVITGVTTGHATAHNNIADTLTTLETQMPISPGGTTSFLRADGTWNVPPGTTTLDSTASDFQPDGVISAGASGSAARADHVHPENAHQYLLLEPSGTLAVTFPRYLCTTAVTPLTNTVYCCAIPLPKGLTVSNIIMMGSTAPETGGSHCWAALLDSTLTVKAVSADNTGATFFTNAAEHTFAMGASYTIPAAGIFYIAWSCVATGMPNLMGALLSSTGAVGSVGGAILYGSAGSQSAPPALAAQLNAGSLTVTSIGAYRARVT